MMMAVVVAVGDDEINDISTFYLLTAYYVPVPFLSV